MATPRMTEACAANPATPASEPVLRPRRTWRFRLLSIGLGLLFGWANQRASSGDGMDVLSIPVGQLGGFALSAVVIGVVAAILPARRAARMDVLSAVSAP